MPKEAFMHSCGRHTVALQHGKLSRQRLKLNLNSLDVIPSRLQLQLFPTHFVSRKLVHYQPDLQVVLVFGLLPNTLNHV